MDTVGYLTEISKARYLFPFVKMTPLRGFYHLCKSKEFNEPKSQFKISMWAVEDRVSLAWVIPLQLTFFCAYNIYLSCP